jgi:hypothetical protein
MAWEIRTSVEAEWIKSYYKLDRKQFMNLDKQLDNVFSSGIKRGTLAKVSNCTADRANLSPKLRLADTDQISCTAAESQFNAQIWATKF